MDEVNFPKEFKNKKVPTRNKIKLHISKSQVLTSSRSSMQSSMGSTIKRLSVFEQRKKYELNSTKRVKINMKKNPISSYYDFTKDQTVNKPTSKVTLIDMASQEEQVLPKRKSLNRDYTQNEPLSIKPTLNSSTFLRKIMQDHIPRNISTTQQRSGRKTPPRKDKNFSPSVKTSKTLLREKMENYNNQSSELNESKASPERQSVLSVHKNNKKGFNVEVDLNTAVRKRQSQGGQQGHNHIFFQSKSQSSLEEENYTKSSPTKFLPSPSNTTRLLGRSRPNMSPHRENNYIKHEQQALSNSPMLLKSHLLSMKHSSNHSNQSPVQRSSKNKIIDKTDQLLAKRKIKNDSGTAQNWPYIYSKCFKPKPDGQSDLKMHLIKLYKQKKQNNRRKVFVPETKYSLTIKSITK